MIQVDFTGATPNIDVTPGHPGVTIDVSKRGPVGPRGQQGPGVGETVASISSQRGWRALRAALASGTARVVAMGDSKTEGAGVSATSDRWLNVLMAGLRARYAPSGDQGLGYLPAWYATFYGFSTAPTTSGSAVTVGNGGGLGNRSRHLAAGGSVTWTVPAWTSGVPLLVHWTQHPGHGDLEVVTGGTVRATIATGGAAIASKVTPVTIPAGTTSVTVRHKAGTGTGNAARVEGIVHRTATTGVVIYDGARSGAKVVDYSEGLGSSGAPDSEDYHWHAVKLVAPHAVIMAFGANDQSDPPGGRTASQWADDLRVAVAKAKAAAPGAGIVLLHGAQRTEEAGDPSRVLAFEAAARDAIGADPDVSILYESQLWAPVVGEDYTDGDGIWLSDTVHTNATANQAIARMLLASITSVDGAADAAALVRDAAAPAVSAAQSSQAASQQAAADAEVAKQAAINAAALVGAPPSEVVSAVVGRVLVDATAHGVPNDGVGGAGSPLNTLISQVSAAGGGTIILPPGVSVASGGITGATGVTVRGASRDGTIIRKSGGTNSSWITTGDNVTAFRIENLTIDGDNKVSSRGITFAAGSKDCALSGVTIKNFGGGGVAVDTLAGASGITIENCLIASVNLAVRLNQGPNQVRIMRCTIRDWQDAAVSIVGDATYSCTDVLVEGNTVHRHAVGTPSTKARQPIRAQGVDTLHHRNVIVRGNTVTSAYTNHQDTLDPGGADLISLHRCTGFEVSGNTVRGGGDVGITIAQGCRDGRVFGNLAEDCDTPGINLGSASSVERVNRVAVFGNTLRNNGRDRADTGGTSIARAVDRAKTNLVVTRAENCVVDGNVLVFDAGHATTPRYGVTWRDSVNCHIGAIGAGNKCVGHTAPYYTEAPASTGMTTTTSTPLTA